MTFEKLVEDKLKREHDIAVEIWNEAAYATKKACAGAFKKKWDCIGDGSSVELEQFISAIMQAEVE